jgi:hypothetical protein
LGSNGRSSAPLTLTPGDGTATIAAEGRYVVRIAAFEPLPASPMLLQNYPNPFNPTTTIPYALSTRAIVTLTVFNLLGETVATLEDRADRAPGFHQVAFDASRLASGIYYYQIRATATDGAAPVFQQVKKFVVMK